MKKITKAGVFWAVMFTIAAGCGGKPLVSGEIKGIGSDSVVIDMEVVKGPDNFETSRQAVYAENGKFTFDAEPEHLAVITITPKSMIFRRTDGSAFWPKSKRVMLVLKPGEKAVINGVFGNNALDYTAESSRFNEDYAKIRSRNLPLAIEADSINILIESGHADEPLFGQLGQLKNRMRELHYRYVDENPDEDLAAYYMLRFPLDSIPAYYAKLGGKAKNGVFREYLDATVKKAEEYREVLETLERITPGADAPRFTLKTPEGGELSLTDIKGRYIVLDFWGSWCGFCIQGFPKMKEYYGKYKGKVEFIGIDCKDTEQEWMDELEKQKLPWKQVIENKDDKVSVEYAVMGYPTKILIDRDYRIVEVFVGESGDFYRKLDELFE